MTGKLLLCSVGAALNNINCSKVLVLTNPHVQVLEKVGADVLCLSK